jgi:signal transduction histidine kinase
MSAGLRLGRFGFQLRVVLGLGVLFLGALDVVNLFQINDDRIRLENMTRRDAAGRTAALVDWLGSENLQQYLGGASGLALLSDARLQRGLDRFELTAITIRARNGRVKNSLGPLPQSNPDEESIPSLSLRGRNGVERVIPGRFDPPTGGDDALVESWWPVIGIDGRRLGSLQLWMAAPDWGRTVSRIRRLYWIQGIGVALIAFLGLIFARWVVKPWENLAEVAGEVGLADEVAGDEDPHALADAIRRVAQKLASQQQDLDRLREEPGRLSDLVRFAEAGGRSMTTGLLVVDRDLGARAANRAARELFGWQERIPDEPWTGREELTERIRKCLAEGTAVTREVLPMPGAEGRSLHLGISLAPCIDDSGVAEGALVLMTDLTEIRQFQQRARFRESLASVGELSAGIAHEVRNALGTILGYARMIEKGSDDVVRQPAQAIRDEIQTLRVTLDAFLQYARPRAPDWEAVDVGEVVDRVLAESGALVNVSRTGEFGTIHADRDLLHRAFRNLLANVEAIAGQEQRTLELTVRGRVEEGSQWICWEDDGPGVPEVDCERIFVPFFSVREGGTGLGLAWVQRTVSDHGGDIHCRESAAGGAAFEIRLPERPPWDGVKV